MPNVPWYFPLLNHRMRIRATIPHLVGIDHARLTFRYSGQDFRLTDVHGDVVDNLVT
jgi:hypothetical protein